MTVYFYEDDLTKIDLGQSIFLAGPTERRDGPTLWRTEAIDYLLHAAPGIDLVVPEFSDGMFDRHAPTRFGATYSGSTTEAVVQWETHGIDNAAVVLFWMPFNHSELPGLTTRSEAAREIEYARHHMLRVVLGIPPTAAATTHLRFHAQRAHLEIHRTLPATLDAALALLASHRQNKVRPGKSVGTTPEDVRTAVPLVEAAVGTLLGDMTAANRLATERMRAAADVEHQMDPVIAFLNDLEERDRRACAAACARGAHQPPLKTRPVWEALTQMTLACKRLREPTQETLARLRGTTP